MREKETSKKFELEVQAKEAENQRLQDRIVNMGSSMQQASVLQQQLQDVEKDRKLALMREKETSKKFELEVQAKEAENQRLQERVVNMDSSMQQVSVLQQQLQDVENDRKLAKQQATETFNDQNTRLLKLQKKIEDTVEDNAVLMQEVNDCRANLRRKSSWFGR
jgi:hypothetical protein